MGQAIDTLIVMMQVNEQFLKYALVGVVSNGISYLLYLLATGFGVGPKMAMTVLFLLGLVQTFVFNKSWSFRFAGAATSAFVRYVTAYAIGYVINFIALVLLVDQAGLPHQLVQGMMILVVAVVLFVAQRYWVFPATLSRDVA